MEPFREFIRDAGAQHDVTLLLILGCLALGVVAKPKHLEPTGAVLGIELGRQLILGNVLIIVLEAFLSGVQALRLQFYEFFTKFYREGELVFKPVKLK